MLARNVLVVGVLVVIANLLGHALPRFTVMQRVWLPWPVLENVPRILAVFSGGYATFILARFSTRFTATANLAMSDTVPPEDS
jgi:hypothetical protein